MRQVKRKHWALATLLCLTSREGTPTQFGPVRGQLRGKSKAFGLYSDNARFYAAEMGKRAQIKPVALTIAGSDSGGGAGIQADLMAFSALGVHGTTVITCLTAQNPDGVRGVQACTPALVQAQIEAVLDGFQPAAAKTGMLFSSAIIRIVAKIFAKKRLPLVVDPVMVATSGARLLKPDALQVLTCELLPMATLITPNLDEAMVLIGRKLSTVEDLKAAARELQERFGCAVLLKGGHLRGLSEAVDIFYDGRQELRLSAPFVRGVSTHGTGCTYSAAITAGLAQGWSLPTSVTRAKAFITAAISGSERAGRYSLLNWQSGGNQQAHRGAGGSSHTGRKTKALMGKRFAEGSNRAPDSLRDD